MGFDLSRGVHGDAGKQSETVFGCAREATHAVAERDTDTENAGVAPCRMHEPISHRGAPWRLKIQQ